MLGRSSWRPRRSIVSPPCHNTPCDSVPIEANVVLAARDYPSLIKTNPTKELPLFRPHCGFRHDEISLFLGQKEREKRWTGCIRGFQVAASGSGFFF